MTVRPKALVLLATWNGERYLADQIETVLAQTDVDVRLIIRDDGSTDGTAAISRRYGERFSNVHFLSDGVHRGSALNFLDLVWTVPLDDADYIAFCDQDDFWLDGKLSRAITAIEAARDAAGGKGRGWLYYSDLINVDERLENPQPSGAAAYASRAHDVQPLLIANWAAGCTMVFDGDLATLLGRYRPRPLLRHHDSWVISSRSPARAPCRIFPGA